MSSLRTLSAIAVALHVFVAVGSAAENVAVYQSAGTRKMAERLDQITRGLDPMQNPFMNAARVEKVRAELQPLLEATPTPEKPEEGKVWGAIAAHHLDESYRDELITVAEVARERLAHHPWTLGGGGAADLKQLLETNAARRLEDAVDLIGFGAVTREDELFARAQRELRDELNAQRETLEGHAESLSAASEALAGSIRSLGAMEAKLANEPSPPSNRSDRA